MNSEIRTKNRGIKQRRTQTRKWEHQNPKTNNTRRTPNNEWGNERNVLSHKTELRRYFRSELDKLNRMRNKQYNNNKTLRVIKRIQIDISIKKDETFNKKRKSKLRYNPK